MRVFAAVFGAFLLQGVSLDANAQASGQPWLGDRRVGGGIGVRAGNFELHPGIASELGFDSNFFQGAGRETAIAEAVAIDPAFRPVTLDGGAFGATGSYREPTVGTLRFRVTPSLTLRTLGAQRKADDGQDAAKPKVALDASLSASYNELVSTEERFADAVSQERFLSADLAVGVDILPGRPWGVGLNAGYNRSVQPVNDPTAPPGFERSTFTGGAALKWRPGGGLLEWSLGYDMAYILFEDTAFSAFTSVQHNLGIRGRWTFLPRTALLYQGQYGIVDYPEGGPIKPTGSPLSSQLGINGLVTNHIAVLAMGGWKTLFFDDGGEFDSVVGRAELTWYPLPRPDLAPEQAAVGLSSISFGYRRDARPAYLGNYAQSDGGYVKGSYFFAGSMLLTVDASYDRFRRPESFFSDGTRQAAEFSDDRITATAFGEYRTSDTFGINTTVRYSSAATDQQVPLVNDPAQTPLPYDDPSFSRIEAWLGVRWFL